MLICSLYFASIFCFQQPIICNPIKYEKAIKTDTFTARITCYNNTGTMANGEQTFIGAVATSDRSIPMNTLVFIQGYGIMKISDKTAKWVHEKHGLTFDIYDPNCSKKFGVKRLKYEIQKEQDTLE